MTIQADAIWDSSWQASLRLRLINKGGKTFLTDREHFGPLAVQKPFYPEQSDCCHVVLLHPPGGIAGGDELRLDVKLDAKAHGLITTPGATKFYRSIGPVAKQEQRITLAEGASIEWLPQETVYFDAAQARTITRIDYTKDSRVLAWEIQCLGLPAQTRSFQSGHIFQTLELWQDGKPQLIESNRYDGSSPLLTQPCGLHAAEAIGSFLIRANNETIEKKLILDILEKHPELRSGCSLIQDIFVIRASATYAEPIKTLFIELWQTIRPIVLQRPACIPRIWLT
mgnify:CR=1 FL=1|jgi:urease accessory protein|tara:strand:+ start:6644 stop:7492 length:849 start_codon:yes stop_codon:yes gene_type:complete